MRSLRPHLPEFAVGAIFFLLACAAIELTRVAGGIALIWPADAAAAALLIRLQRVRWLGTGLILLLTCVAANVLVARRDWPISIVFSCIHVAEIGAVVWLFRSMTRFDYPNISIGQSAIMAAGFGVAVPGLFAIAGGTALFEHYGLPLSEGIFTWWSSHTLGACLIGPPIILWSAKSLRRLVATRFLVQNLATLFIVLLGCWMAIRYVRFPMVVVGVPLLIAAFRVGGFGASLLSLCAGLLIAALWSLGVRPLGLEGAPLAVTSLVDLPVIAVLATIMPPIAVGLGTDARRAAVRKLNVSERRFRESMEHSPIGMLIADLNGVWDYTNIALQKMLGYGAEEFRAMGPGGPLDSTDAEEVARLSRALQSGLIEFHETDQRFAHRRGGWVWVHTTVSLVRDADGAPLHYIAQVESLEARRRAEADLAEERERLRVTLSSIADAVITTDTDTCITYLNAAAEKLLGQALRDLKRRRLAEVISLTDPGTLTSAENLMGQSLLHGTEKRRESACVLHRSDGMVCYVRDVISPVHDSNGLVTGLVVVLQDVGADFERAREVSYRASHDILTGLANRFEFQRKLTRAFRRARRATLPAAILAIDLDRFKAVNDIGGHAAGDAMLRRVAEVLRGSISVRKSDTVARLGGDEFAIILEKCPPTRCALVGEEILRVLNPLRIHWEGMTHEIGASVGLAMLTSTFDTEASWMAAADRACYQAKRQGRAQLQVGPTED